MISLDRESILQEAQRIINHANELSIPLRIVGGLAVYLDISDDDESRTFFEKARFFSESQGLHFGDIDFISYSNKHIDVKNLLEGKLLYTPDRYVNTIYANRRNIFYHSEKPLKIDVFYDQMNFSHPISFVSKNGSGRLELSRDAINPTDLVLTKLQIHEINKRDLVDIASLFIRHSLGDVETGINATRITELLSEDWGFWYDASNNLGNAKKMLGELAAQGKVSADAAAKALDRIGMLEKAIENSEKTKSWLKRQKKGTKKIWYNIVEDVER